MATTKPSPSDVSSSKFLSRSSESLTATDPIADAQHVKQSSKSSKMKKSQTALSGFEAKLSASPHSLFNSTSALRRRFSLFRIKRSQQQQQQHSAANEPANGTSHVHALQQIIDQLRRDLQLKTDELETMRQRIERKRSSIAVSSNDSIGHAMQLQTVLNARLEEMLVENDLLKKSIHELEAFAQQQQRKCVTGAVNFRARV